VLTVPIPRQCAEQWHHPPLPWTRSIECLCLFVCIRRDSPQRARASSFKRFLDHTQRRTTVGRTPLDEWSTRRRELYLTIHNTHDRQTSMPPVGFEHTISAGERPQTYALDRAATGTGEFLCHLNILTLSPLTTSRKISWNIRRTGLLPFKWLHNSYIINESDTIYEVRFVVQSPDWQIHCTYCLTIVLLLPCQNCAH